MEGKFPSKILVFVMAITHNCDNFSCWSQIFHILPSICEGFILPLQIRFFERAFWVRQKLLVANRHFSRSERSLDLIEERRENAMVQLAYYQHKLKQGYDAKVKLRPLELGIWC